MFYRVQRKMFGPGKGKAERETECGKLRNEDVHGDIVGCDTVWSYVQVHRTS